MGDKSRVDVVSMRVADGDRLQIEGVDLEVLYTPGHTDDSCCFRMQDRVFTGDTLLIRGTGRTDFQNGDARAQYQSIFGRLLHLPDDTLVYPGHDYKGDTVSTIGEERRWNPRLQVKSVDEYVELMHNLKLANPKMMDVAVPANMKVGLHQEEIVRRECACTAEQVMSMVGQADVALIDLRERSERERHGVIPGSLHVPYPALAESTVPGGMLHALATATGKRLVFYCAFGERSAMAVQCAQEAGLSSTCHLQGGLAAWKAAGGPLDSAQKP
jgi:rhodanese-related sulfurtransferase